MVYTYKKSINGMELTRTLAQKLAAATSPKTSPEILETLATDKDSSVLWYVARNPNTSQKALELLAANRSVYIRALVATNQNTSPKALELLATDESSSIRQWVTQNPNKTELIERLVFMTNYKQEAG
jgi:hypothetical protein